MEHKVYSRLLAVQSELVAPKNQKNSFGGYNYRSCEDILEAVKPLLKKYNLTLILSDSVKEMGGRFYVEATAKIVDIETGDIIVNTALAREEDTKKGMDASQITGASSSYARKYALNGLFCIDDNKDSDVTKNDEEPPKQKSTSLKGFQPDAGTITSQQLEAINKLNLNVDAICEYLGVPSLDMLSAEQAQWVINAKTPKEAK